MELERRASARKSSQENFYAHVESKIKTDRVAFDDSRVAQAEAKAPAESHAMDVAEKASEFERPQQLVESGAKPL